MSDYSTPYDSGLTLTILHEDLHAARYIERTLGCVHCIVEHAASRQTGFPAKAGWTRLSIIYTPRRRYVVPESLRLLIKTYDLIYGNYDADPIRNDLTDISNMLPATFYLEPME